MSLAVTTTSGEHMRQQALALLQPRYEELRRRSATEFRFSEIERQHMNDLLVSLIALESMAPEGELLPPRGTLAFGGDAPRSGKQLGTSSA